MEAPGGVRLCDEVFPEMRTWERSLGARSLGARSLGARSLGAQASLPAGFAESRL